MIKRGRKQRPRFRLCSIRRFAARLRRAALLATDELPRVEAVSFVYAISAPQTVRSVPLT
jgi:hypothetical protein